MGRPFVDDAALCPSQASLSTKSPKQHVAQFAMDIINHKIRTKHYDKVRSAIKEKGIRGAPASILNNRDYLLYAIKQDHFNWPDIPVHIRNDPKFALEAVKAHWKVYYVLPEALRARKEIALAAMRQWPFYITRVPVSLLQDAPEVALTAVTDDSRILERVLAIKGLVLSKERKIALFKAAAKDGSWSNLDYCLARPEKFPLMHKAYSALHTNLQSASASSLRFNYMGGAQKP